MTILASMHPSVTIITVVKDDCSGLKNTAGSIISQIDIGFEWLIVDGFSTDGSWEFAQELEIHPFVTLTQAPPNGIYAAMNFGAKKAHGSWLWFINAGDVLLGDQIVKKIEEFISLNMAASIIASPVLYLTPSQHYYSLSIPKIIDLGLTRYAIFHHQGCILNSSIFTQAGGFDESFKFAADGKLIDSMISISNPFIISTVTVGFEMGGATSKNFWSSLKEIRSYRREVLTRKSMVVYQLKEILRSLMLTINKSLFGKLLLLTYFEQRQKSVIDSAKLLDIELVQNNRVIS